MKSIQILEGDVTLDGCNFITSNDRTPPGESQNNNSAKEIHSPASSAVEGIQTVSEIDMQVDEYSFSSCQLELAEITERTQNNLMMVSSSKIGRIQKIMVRNY